MNRRLGLGLLTGSVLALAALAGPARAEEPDPKSLYDVTFTATPKLAKGKQGTLVVKITPKGEGELHGDTPLSLSLEAPAHVTLPKARLGRADAKVTAAGTSFETSFSAQAPASGKISGTVSFIVCTKVNCFPQKVSGGASVAIE
jgi:hypothetical protein